ncbi:MarR family winged helix-turn-helix transcriptional regulator [Nocardia huaxiensis]|uniref:MarR family winged helix-turn-helix transcriptional regulator n=1 Tax=Nocardia huaxiensis TaxID=2755382 RepID=UPI001E32F494|nr:MarR family transcriptional regulator [Nocardia huaxiensis]UFS99070.1 MarR family transcriptional regulator [Nocardia huaxiensis]
MSAQSKGRSAEDLATAATELRVVTSRLLRHLRTARAKMDLTPSQAVALSRIGSDGPCTIAELARAEKVRPQSMRTTLAALEERGLVERSPHPTDQRQVLMSLSAAGEQVLRLAHDAKEDWLAAAMATRLTPAEQDSLLAALPLLGRLAES